MSRLLLVDPQFGPYGLGMLADRLPDAVCDPAATVHSILAMAQVVDVMDRLQRADSVPRVIAARGAGCNVAARLLARHEIDRVLLIDPIPTFTRDRGFNRASRTDTQLAERIAAELENGFDAETAALWSDPLVAEGRLPESAYGLMANEMSRRPEVRERLKQALHATESPRQPYEQRHLSASLKAEEEFDWLADIRSADPRTVTIWLSHDMRGSRPQAQHDYLVDALPGVPAAVQPWQTYDFLAYPEPMAGALRDWLDGSLG